MNSQGSNWMPSIDMPPLGFGVVMPQPSGNLHNPALRQPITSIGAQSQKTGSQNTWQYQQFLLAQQGLPLQSDGVSNVPVYPQQYFASTQQQQQWVLQQKRAVQGQQILNEKIKKQQQFNEQKQRLQDFNSCKSKGTCSADAMIQNILSKDESSSRAKIEKREPIFSCTETDDKKISIAPAYIPVLTQNICVPPSYQQAKIISQSSIPTDSASSQCFSQAPVHCTNGRGIALPPSYHPGTTAVSLDAVVMENLDSLKVQHSKYVTNGSSTHSHPVLQRVPLQLPDWLTDRSNMPEVYKKACDLVESNNGWVDTSRAYMLLMRTNVPPHLLGVLWEMVNRNEPGRLQIPEFCGLLALVSLIQSGKTFTDAEILKSTISPLYPLIDHPALLTLSQIELNKQPKCVEANVIASVPITNVNILPPSEEFQEDDEFDDFVSAATPTLPPESVTKIATLTPVITNDSTPIVANDACSIVQPVTLVHKSKTADSERSLNFPTLGNSPLNHNKSNKHKEADEFCDFISALNPAEDLVLSMGASSSSSQDKYDVFRELTSTVLDSSCAEFKKCEKTVEEEKEETFGDFCSSVPVLTKEEPSLNLNSHILKICKSSKLENENFVPNFSKEIFKNNDFSLKVEFNSLSSEGSWAKDPFGEFDVPNKVNAFPADFSSDSSQYVTANASAETLSDPDDDFGDFIGPSEVTKETASYSLSYSNNLHELQSETQSVASLELPGLELTVNLSAEVFKIEQQARVDDQVDFENQFKTLSLDLPGTAKESGQATLPLVVPDVIPFADKYSIIRDEQVKAKFEEPHVESWKKCLNGSNKLLQEGMTILEDIKGNLLLHQVLETSQMRDYLLNLAEVFEVQMRIQTASHNMTTTNEIQELLMKGQNCWKSIMTTVGEKIDLKANSDHESKSTVEECLCSLCLVSGGASLQHGGFSYHPPCANLWLNDVDLTLPSLVQSKGSFL